MSHPARCSRNTDMTRYLILTMFAGAAQAWAGTVSPACQPVFDAMSKITSIPVHMYSTETAAFRGGKTRSSEIIYLDHATYIQVNGKWRTSPMSQEELKSMKKDQPETSATCRALREEPVDGENA